MLSFELDPSKFAYAQSKAKLNTGKMLKGKPLTTCQTTGGVNLAQIVVGEFASYGCTYPGSRVEYSALEVTTPSGFTSQVRKHRAVKHTARRAARR